LSCLSLRRELENHRQSYLRIMSNLDRNDSKNNIVGVHYPQSGTWAWLNWRGSHTKGELSPGIVEFAEVAVHGVEAKSDKGVRPKTGQGGGFDFPAWKRKNPPNRGGVIFVGQRKTSRLYLTKR